MSEARTAVGSATFASQPRALADRSARAAAGSSFSGRQSSTNRATRYVARTTSRGPPSGARAESDDGDAALAELGTQASAAAAVGGFDAQGAHLSRTPITVDARGWKEIARELDALLPRIQKIEAESQKRLLKNDHQDERRATVGLLLFGAADVPAPEPAPKRQRRPARSARASSNGRAR